MSICLLIIGLIKLLWNPVFIIINISLGWVFVFIHGLQANNYNFKTRKQNKHKT